MQASWFLKYLFKGFRSFYPVNIGSVDQKATKLPPVKVGGLKKKPADLAFTDKNLVPSSLIKAY